MLDFKLDRYRATHNKTCQNTPRKETAPIELTTTGLDDYGGKRNSINEEIKSIFKISKNYNKR